MSLCTTFGPFRTLSCYAEVTVDTVAMAAVVLALFLLHVGSCNCVGFVKPFGPVACGIELQSAPNLIERIWLHNMLVAECLTGLSASCVWFLSG